jgi:hypothetical protein
MKYVPLLLVLSGCLSQTFEPGDCFFSKYRSLSGLGTHHGRVVAVIGAEIVATNALGKIVSVNHEYMEKQPSCSDYHKSIEFYKKYPELL